MRDGLFHHLMILVLLMAILLPGGLLVAIAWFIASYLYKKILK